MKQPLRSTTETARISTGDPLPKQPGSLREIHYRNSRDLCGRSTTFASLRPCVFAFISPREHLRSSRHIAVTLREENGSFIRSPMHAAESRLPLRMVPSSADQTHLRS